MEKNIGNTYSGTISFINEFGCNVELENGIE
jgi:predicted RNA-binding protein with RPS1 domain